MLILSIAYGKTHPHRVDLCVGERGPVPNHFFVVIYFFYTE